MVFQRQDYAKQGSLLSFRLCHYLAVVIRYNLLAKRQANASSRIRAAIVEFLEDLEDLLTVRLVKSYSVVLKKDSRYTNDPDQVADTLPPERLTLPWRLC